MNQYVGVRMVKANSMDLSLFQFDYDMTFAVFLMNADKTIYGRYGTRSEYKKAGKEMSLPGFSIALERALKLHQRYPQNKDALLAKTGPESRYKIPEEFPALRGFKSKLDYRGNVMESCIHCHQILDAKRDVLRNEKQEVSDRDLFPFPLPDLVGLEFDPTKAAQVKRVAADSPAAEAGFQVGDDIVVFDGQPIISIADVQWVLHQSKSPIELATKVRRDDQLVSLNLSLPAQWRRQSDILWRATTWEMNRLVGGSLKWVNLDQSERDKLGLAADAIAIQVDYVGWWGKYQAGKRAGFLKDDVMISFDGQRNLKNVNEFYAYAMNKTIRGEKVDVEILRKGRKMKLQLPMQ